MSLVSRRGITHDVNSFDQTAGDVLEVLLSPTGNITKDANGLAMAVDLGEFRGVFDPAGGGGAIALPVPGTVTVNPGTAIEAGQYVIVSSVGSLGGIAVAAGDLPALLMANVDAPAADGDWSLIAGASPDAKADKATLLTAGDGLTGGGDLAADRTVTVQPLNDSITVAAGGISVNPASLISGGTAAIDADQVQIDTTLANITPNVGQATVTATTHLGAIIAGVDDALGNVPAATTDMIAGDGLTGGGTLAATRTFNVVGGNGITANADDIAVNPDATTGGDTTPVTVGVNGVGWDITAGDGDHLGVDFTPVNYTATVTGAPTAADAADLAAHLKGIDNELANAGRVVEIITLTAGMVAAFGFSVAGTPGGVPNMVATWTQGGTAVVGDGITLAGQAVAWVGLPWAGAVETGDTIVVEYSA